MGPWVETGPHETVRERDAREAAEERQLAAARDSFPGWKIHEAWDGWMALPEGTPVITAENLDGLVGKLRNLEP